MNRIDLLGACAFAAAVACASPPPPHPSPPASPQCSTTPDELARQPTCDEVSCVLADHHGACCYRLEHPAWATFDDAIASVGDAANRCAVAPRYDGVFPVAVTFDERGVVTGVDKPAAFQGALDPSILGCIGALVRPLRLPATPGGSTLTYVFELHPPP